MARTVDVGRGVAIIPSRVFDAAERGFDADRVRLLVIYPDHATGGEVVEMMRQAVFLQDGVYQIGEGSSGQSGSAPGQGR